MKKPLVRGMLVVAFLLLSLGKVASAIPAFARKYKTSCATCHEAFPRLNGVGESFRLNGYKFQDDELYIKDEPMELGDEAYKKVWPKAIYPTDMPWLPPISIVFDSKYEIDTGGTKRARSQFLFPNTAKLIGAGAMGDNLSFFFELGFDRSGGEGHGGHGEEGATEGTVTEVEGWLQFEDVIGPENVFNVRVGTVGMHEMGLFVARDHNRMSVNPYLHSSWAMPSPGHHFVEELGFDEDEDTGEFDGNGFTIHAQPGVEINGFGRWWRYAVGIVNGNGDDFEDNNSDKDLYFHVAYKIGGVGFDGSGGDGEEGVLSDAESWRDDSVIISAFGYSGTSPIEIEVADSSEDEEFTFGSEDNFCRLGIAIQWKHHDLALRGGYVYGRNDNPFGDITRESVESQAWFAEAEYFVLPWLIPYARYEGLGLALPSGVEGIPSEQDRQRALVGTRVLIRANVSMNVEGRV